MKKVKLRYKGKIPIRILGIGDIKPGDTVEMDERKAREFSELPNWELVTSKKKKEVSDGGNRNR